MSTNNSKPYQSKYIRAHGFEIPETLITTDPDPVLDFWKRHGAVIYKSTSGTRSIVSRLTDAHRARLESVVWCPTQFQQYIAGDDYRVHVVGDRVFACRIRSSVDDYRYASREGASVEIEGCAIAEEVSNRCRALAADLGLHVAGLDLRMTLAGEWYCFEVNPSPGFSYYEEETGQPIAEAIADLLLAAQE